MTEREFLKQLQQQYNIPKNVLEVILNSPFDYTLKVTKSETDIKDIWYRGFARLKIKPKWRNGKQEITNNFR